MRHVRQVNRRGADLLDWQPIEGCERWRERVGADNELLVAVLGIARWECEILRVNRVHHVVRRDAVRAQRVRVEVDHDLPIFAAAIGSRQRDARDGRQRLAYPVEAVVVQLLFVQRIGAEAELQDRNGRSVVLDYNGRLNADRHYDADGVGR